MSSTDDRIVRMQFDNKQFMKAAADTQKSLADTNKAVDGAGKSKGLLDLSGQMNTVAVTASKMQVITTTALATIANKAVNAGLNMAKSLTFTPIKEGFLEYESLLTKQNVIMNATGKSAGEVKRYLNELNSYSDQTIYSFGNMTDSITKFVNAGVPLPRAVVSIKGIANAAAYSGATTQEANRAMYAFSQSMQTGFIMLNDWMQIENANMGTQQFKNTLLEAGVAAGTLTKQGKGYVTASGKFVSSTKGWRDSLQEQWATTEVLNSALGKYADTNTKLGKKAFESATQVRTFSAFMDTLKESLGSGWASVFTGLIGNLKQATSFWTGFSNVVSNSVSTFFNFISTAVTTWRKMGGFEKTLQGFKNLLSPIGALLGAIGDAWKAAFPSSNKGAGKALYGLSAGFELITRPLSWLAKGIPAITPVLTFLFSAIGKGVSVLKGGIGYISDFVETVISLVQLQAPNAGGFVGFLQTIVTVAKAAYDEVTNLINKGKSLGGALSGISLPSISMPSMPDLGGASKAGNTAAASAKSSASAMQSAANIIQSALVKIGAGFSWLWDTVTGFFSDLTAEDLVKAFNQAIFATMSYELIRFVHTFRKGFQGVLDVVPGFVDLMDNLGSSLTGFAQAQKREATAKLLISLGIALALMAASLWLLSKIPGDKMLKALAGLGALAFILNKSMGAFGDMIEKMDKKGTFGKTIALSIAMLALSASMIMLATALLIMNKVEWGSLVKGLGSMFVMMKVLEKLGDMGENAAKNLISGAAAIMIVSASMIVLAGALLLFKLVDWESMGKAGAALAAVSLAVGLLALIPYEGIAKVGLALLAASVGMVALANALILFALVEWESMGKAAIMLGVLALAVGAILWVSAGGAGAGIILALAAAMIGLALACMMFNNVDWESIGKAAVVLGILTVAVALMATILTAFLYAIAPVAPVLIVLAAGFALLGVGLLAFAAALALAVSLAAAGTAAFAALATGAAVAIGVFFQVLAQQAPVMRESILKILQEMINTVVESVPMVIQGFKRLWNAIMKELQDGKKKKSFGELADEWLTKLEGAVRKYIPRLTRLGLDIVLGFMRGLRSRIDVFVAVGVDIIVKFLEGVEKRMDRITRAATDLIIEFARSMGENNARMLNAGINLIAEFLHDLASAIRNGSQAIGGGLTDVADAMRDVGVDMVRGLIGGVTSMAEQGVGAIGGLATSMISAARDRFKIWSPSRVFRDIGKFVVQGLTKGIQNNAASAIVAVASMVTGAIAVADDYVSKYFQKLDQQAIAARAKAQGLAAAAAKARKAAGKTKSKEDNKAAQRLTKEAKKAAKDAKQEEKEARNARAAEARKRKWERASSAERAEMRGNQAQSQLAGAKAAEKAAEAARVQAAALREQAKKAGDEKSRKALLKAAKDAAKEARKQAERANSLIKGARKSSLDAIKYQKLAAEEAAAAFQKQFDAEAQADADAEAFEKLSDAEKAEKRRQQAVEMQLKAEENLAKAKEIAKTDLERANELAAIALQQAEQARQYQDEAEQYAGQNGPGAGTGTVIDLTQTDDAAAAFNNYADLYDAATAAAAASKTIEFNQYNTSPESLSDAEIYRQTNNQLTFASEKLAGAAA